MSRTTPRSAVIALIALFCVPLVVFAAGEVPIAPSASMNEQVLHIPGDSTRPATLVATLLKPDGPGPFPLVVMNHGASGKPNPSDEPRYRYSFSSYYFLSRGFAVVLPMMRGFSGSDGRQFLDGCNQEAVGIGNARDIAAAAPSSTRRDARAIRST